MTLTADLRKNIVLEDVLPTVRVLGVYVNGSQSGNAWTPTFRDYVDGGFGDGSAIGYPIPLGAAQADTLPWINVNEIIVQFSHNVGASINPDGSDFVISGTPGLLTNSSEGIFFQLTTLPTITGASFNTANNTATLTLDDVIDPAVIDLTVLSAGIFNAGGQLLDGEWTNNVALCGHTTESRWGQWQWRRWRRLPVPNECPARQCRRW